MYGRLFLLNFYLTRLDNLDNPRAEEGHASFGYDNVEKYRKDLESFRDKALVEVRNRKLKQSLLDGYAGVSSEQHSQLQHKRDFLENAALFGSQRAKKNWHDISTAVKSALDWLKDSLSTPGLRIQGFAGLIATKDHLAQGTEATASSKTGNISIASLLSN